MKSLRTDAHQALRRILVRARKNRSKLTQTQLARRLGRSQPWVSQVETGDLRLDVIEFVQWCRELGLQPGRVLGRLPLRSR